LFALDNTRLDLYNKTGYKRLNRGAKMNGYEIRYYQKGHNNPVDDFIQARTEKERAKIMYYIGVLREKGPALHEPYVKKVSGKIYELRPGFAGSEFRIFFFWSGKTAVLLHAIIKKDQKLKRNDIEIAESRMKEFTGGIL
jgi:phage-related protein